MRLPSRSLAFTAAFVLCASCAGRRKPPADEPPRPDASGWVSVRLRDHPLVGKIWSPAKNAFVDAAALDAAAAAAHHLLLGETHDNPDHHLIQARLVRTASSTGRRPALVLEMVDTNQQPQIDAALAREGATPRDLAAAVGWAETGWPPFRIYQPIIEAALTARLPVIAGNLPREHARALMKSGPSSLSPAVRQRLDRVDTFPDDVLEALRKEMSDSHCGEFPASRMGPMVLAQKAKDAQLAERLASADRGDGTILIAGRAHVRTDVGVPRFLAGDRGESGILSVGITEVSAEGLKPEDYRSEYGAGPLPFDLVVFTPATERSDPCVELRAREEKKRGARPAAPPADSGTSL